MGKPINEAKQLLEEMASNNYHWCGEQSNLRIGARLEVNAFTLLASKVDALFQNVDRLQTSHHRGISTGSSRNVSVYEVCGV